MTTINNKELDLFGISKVIFFNLEPSTYVSNSYWNQGSLKPVKGKKTEQYRKLSTKFNFKGDNRENVLKNISKFIEESKDAIFKRDNLLYEVEINSSKEPTILNSVTFMIEVEYDIVDVYEAEKSITTTTNTTININSPKPCYADLELTTTSNVISCTVKINETEITVKNIKGGETVYIGSGKVIAGRKSKINDVEMWEFPILKPGINKIEVNRADVNLTVKYCERW